MTVVIFLAALGKILNLGEENITQDRTDPPSKAKGARTEFPEGRSLEVSASHKRVGARDFPLKTTLKNRNVYAAVKKVAR